MKKTAQFKKYKLVKQLGSFRSLRFSHLMYIPKKYILALLKVA